MLISVKKTYMVVTEDKAGPVICDSPKYNPNFHDDAYLIAAAPELLEACEWMVKYGAHQWNPGADNEPRFMDLVRAAIAKATGES